MTAANPGGLRRVDPQVLDEDPFWSVVRRRHPDLAIVITSPEEREVPDPALPSVPLSVLRELAAELVATWRLVEGVLAGLSSPPDASVRWASAPGGHALVVERSFTGVDGATGPELMRAVAVRLDEVGWRFAPGERRGHPLLKATNGRLDAEVESGAVALTVTMASGVLSCTEADRDTVRREIVASGVEKP